MGASNVIPFGEEHTGEEEAEVPAGKAPAVDDDEDDQGDAEFGLEARSAEDGEEEEKRVSEFGGNSPQMTVVIYRRTVLARMVSQSSIGW